MLSSIRKILKDGGDAYKTYRHSAEGGEQVGQARCARLTNWLINSITFRQELPLVLLLFLLLPLHLHLLLFFASYYSCLCSIADAVFDRVSQAQLAAKQAVVLYTTALRSVG